MDSSSSFFSSVLSFQSSFSGESTPEYDPKTAYEALAPLWWDEWEWDSSSESGDEPMPDGGADLQFLVGGELEEESDDDLFSWDGDISSDGEEEMEEDTSSEEYLPVKRFRAGSWDDDDDEDEEEAPAARFSSDEDSAGSSADDSEYGDGEGSDGGEGADF